MKITLNLPASTTALVRLYARLHGVTPAEYIARVLVEQIESERDGRMSDRAWVAYHHEELPENFSQLSKKLRLGD